MDASEGMNTPEYNRMQIRQIIEHFKAVPHVSNEVLTKYCQRKKLNVITATDYDDWLYEYNADLRMVGFVDDAMKVIARYKSKPVLATKAEQDQIDIDNMGIEIDLCQLLEKHEVPYDKHLDNMLNGLGSALKGLTTGALARSSNLAINLFSEFAKEKLGDPISFKAMGEEMRTRHPVEDEGGK